MPFLHSHEWNQKSWRKGYKVYCDPLPDFKHEKKVTGKLYQLIKVLVLDLIEGSWVCLNCLTKLKGLQAWPSTEHLTTPELEPTILTTSSTNSPFTPTAAVATLELTLPLMEETPVKTHKSASKCLLTLQTMCSNLSMQPLRIAGGLSAEQRKRKATTKYKGSQKAMKILFHTTYGTTIDDEPPLPQENQGFKSYFTHCGLTC